jgi:hypothetical protein
MMSIDELRGTGRTYRMMIRARIEEGRGRAVYVIAANHSEKQRLEAMIPEERTSIKVEVPDNTFDWQRLTVPGAHPNCVFLVDHYAIESHFALVLEMLHRFDPLDTPERKDA